MAGEYSFNWPVSWLCDKKVAGNWVWLKAYTAVHRRLNNDNHLSFVISLYESFKILLNIW